MVGLRTDDIAEKGERIEATTICSCSSHGHPRRRAVAVAQA